MAAIGSGRGTMDSQNQVQSDTEDRLKLLYPNVNEDETPLPRSWSTKDKFSYIGLSQNNLRVHYKGGSSGPGRCPHLPYLHLRLWMYRHGKTHKDAASVRATHPIPAACGLYYFEVRIVSKGRDGYMGIGLSAHGVNMNRLPGWDKHSYGYHGDDGHSFCSSGTGQPGTHVGEGKGRVAKTWATPRRLTETWAMRRLLTEMCDAYAFGRELGDAWVFSRIVGDVWARMASRGFRLATLAVICDICHSICLSGGGDGAIRQGGCARGGEAARPTGSVLTQNRERRLV
ncbi:PREDICTED: ran-binding protein 10 [Papilio polytes]|uniref:ran-binding protein 10 n=1 Tax=Papilio polytes TaxID=76194 RepID=UPI0006765442|nr:PREDICTED: ran-binding protein 10 [Papilio polytes]